MKRLAVVLALCVMAAVSMLAEHNEGNGWTIDDRQLVSEFPVPDYPFHEEGKLTLNIVVDKEGRVIEAEVNGCSTIEDADLIAAAKAAAMKAVFTPATDGMNDTAEGTLCWIFTRAKK